MNFHWKGGDLLLVLLEPEDTVGDSAWGVK